MSYNYRFSEGRRNRIVGPSRLTTDADIFTPTTDQKHALGCEFDLNDGTGRWFRYCHAGEAISKALVASSAALDAQAITSTVQTLYGAAAGADKFDVLLTTGHGITTNMLRNGWLLVSDGGSAMSDMYMIKENKVDAATPATVMNVTIADVGGLRTAIAATDDVILLQSAYANTIVSDTAPLGAMVGVSLADVPSGSYYWAQFRGYCPILGDDTDTLTSVGDIVTLSDSVDGTVHINDGLVDDIPVGTLILGSAVNEPAVVNLLIP